MKGGTQEKRGLGVRRKVTNNGLLPGNWATFLRCSENKAELFPFLSEVAITNISHKLLLATANDKVLSIQQINLESLMPCNIEEAEERIFVHVLHSAALNPRILIKAGQ